VVHGQDRVPELTPGTDDEFDVHDVDDEYVLVVD